MPSRSAKSCNPHSTDRQSDGGQASRVTKSPFSKMLGLALSNALPRQLLVVRFHSARRPNAIALPLSQLVAEIVACLLGESLQALHDFWILGSDVLRFPHVVLQIKQLQTDLRRLVIDWQTILAPGPAGQSPIAMREMQLPLPIAYRLQLATGIVAVKHVVR